jgi:hypothetical protein
VARATRRTGPGGDNPETGKRTGTSMDMRTYKLSVRYLF